MNKIFLIGNLTADPKLNYTTKEDIPVCNFTIAVNNYGTDRTDFFKITAWSGLGENVEKYCSKGKKVAVIGELRMEVYEDSEGIKRTAVKINAQEIEFLSTGNTDKSVEEKGALQGSKTEKKAVLQPVEDDDDILF